MPNSAGWMVLLSGPADRAHALSVCRFIGIDILQQESGQGPRLANGAACCAPDPTSHAPPPPPPLVSIAGAARSVWLPSPAPVRGKIRCGWRAGGVGVPQVYTVPHSPAQANLHPADRVHGSLDLES